MSHPFGRQPIGPNQPPGGGTNYPFVAPEDDVRQLLGDFYLSYEDDTCAFALPLRVTWLYGFGDNVVAAPSGTPTPVHAQDLVVKDAEGVTVFDSTQAVDFKTTVWGGRLLVLEWTTETQVCRCTVHTAWDAEDTPLTYDNHIVPENGELDARTYNRLPGRVKAFRVGLQTITGNVQFDAGFNMAIAGSSTPRTDGTLFVDRVDMDAVPGAGLGRQPGCEEAEVVTRLINAIGPDKGGNFIIELDECYRGQLAAFAQDTEDGRTAEYGADIYTDEEAKSALRIFNDCQPCCPCDYYVRTYKGLKRVWDKWKTAGVAAEEVRDLYKDNVNRWEEQRQCRIEHPARLVVSADKQCRVFVGGTYCNFSKCCLRDIEFRFTFEWIRNGQTEPEPVHDLRVFDSFVNASYTEGEEPITPLVTASTVRFLIDYADPQAITLVKFRVCITCERGDTLKVWFSVHVPDPGLDAAGEPCELPVIEIPAHLIEIWLNDGLPEPEPARALVVKLAPLDPVNPVSSCVVC